MTTDTNKIVHHSVRTTKRAYVVLNHHIRLREITQMRLKS